MDKAKELQEPVALDHSTRQGDTSIQGTLDHVRLPQIKLQSFNGDVDQWLSFRDLFTSLIHWKAELPEVEKFHYLKGLSSGGTEKPYRPFEDNPSQLPDSMGHAVKAL